MNAELISAHWPLTGVSVGPSFSTYPTRRAYIVHAEQGTYIAKADSESESNGLRHGAAVLSFLANLEFAHAPRVLATRSGETVVSGGGAALCLMEYVPAPLAESFPPEVMWRLLGEVAARLNAIAGAPSAFAIPIDAAIAEIAAWANGRAIERRVLALLDRLADLRALPSGGLVHGEINEANGGCRADGTIVLFDWDQAGRGPAVLDYAYPLIIGFLSEDDGRFDRTKAASFYDGYVHAGGTIPDPFTAFSGALLHALRYMRFGDWERRWGRICHALEREEELCSVIP